MICFAREGKFLTMNASAQQSREALDLDLALLDEILEEILPATETLQQQDGRVSPAAEATSTRSRRRRSSATKHGEVPEWESRATS